MLTDLKDLNQILIKSGIDIKEMNCVRKHLSNVKGGHLLKAISPATSFNLILSGVIGDQLDVIASGPTIPDPTTFKEAVEILKKYKLVNNISTKNMTCLGEGVAGKHAETLKYDYRSCKTENRSASGSLALVQKNLIK